MKKLSIFWCLCLVLLVMCVFESAGQDTIIENSQASQPLDQTGIIYRNPRPLNITYSFELAPDPKKIDRAKDLKLWLPIPCEWDSQKSVKILSVNPPAHALYEDPEYGNRILFWDFGKEPEQASYKVEIKVRFISYEIHAEVDPEHIEPYDKTSKEYKLYTRSERTICITPRVKELAQQAVGDETNPYLQAKRIFEFVSKKMHYKVTFERGIQYLLDSSAKDEKSGEEYYIGGCGQYSALFVALCRAVGIPARTVYAFYGWLPWIKEKDLQPLDKLEPSLSPSGLAGGHYQGGSRVHMWAEFYLPNYGWVPIDATDGKFGHLNNRKMILSKGRDIKIGPHAPQEQSEGYGFQWNLINDGMIDSLLGVWNIAKIPMTRFTVLHYSDPFPADAIADYSNLLYPKDDAEKRLLAGRIWTLEQISCITRVYPDREKALAKVFDEFPYSLTCDMLRKVAGDDVFFQILGEYENLLVNSDESVSTERFQKLAEGIYGKPLDWFFEQWLESKELPQFRLDKVTVNRKGLDWQVRGHLLQAGNIFFRTPVEFALDTEKGSERHIIWQDKIDVNFEFQTSNNPIKLRVDPDYDILKIQRMPPRLGWFWYSYPNQSSGKNIPPVYVLIYGTISEAEANKTAAERFNNEYLSLGPDIIKADIDVTEDDLNANFVFLFGRPETNKIAQRFKDIFPIRFDDGKFIWQGTIYDQPAQGVAQIVDNPLDEKCLLILYAGLSSKATLQICDSYLYDAKASYVIFDGDKQLLSGDWEDTDSDLVWKFKFDGE